MLGAMCGMYGGKKVRETLVWEEVLFFALSLCLGQQRNLMSKPEKLWAPPGDIGLGGSDVFLPSVCAWVSKGMEIQNLEKLWAQPQNSFVWCHVRGNVWDVWGKRGQGKRWFGRKCCFLHSVCAWVSKGIWFQNLKNFEPHPQKSFVWCHVRGNVRDVWGKEVRETLAWEEVLFFYPQCVLGSAKELKSFEPQPQIIFKENKLIKNADINILVAVFSVKIVITEHWKIDISSFWQDIGFGGCFFLLKF